MRALRLVLVLAAILAPTFASAGPAPPPVTLTCDPVTAIPGGVASLEISMLREGEALVAGTQNDLRFDPANFSIDAETDCIINPAIGPGSSVDKRLFASNPPGESPRARVLIVALDNDNVIPPGLLYTCAAHVSQDVALGTYVIENTDLVASSSTGTRIPVGGQNCEVNVVTPTPTVECVNNDDCPPGEVCVDNHCVVATPTPTPIGFCNIDQDCPPGQVCVDHHCVTPTPTATPIGFCNIDQDCPPGQVCVDHHCVTATPTPRCRQNTDCPSGQVCIDGNCVTSTPSATPTVTPTAKKKKSSGGCSCEIDPNVPPSRTPDALAILLPALVLMLRWRWRRAGR